MALHPKIAEIVANLPHPEGPLDPVAVVVEEGGEAHLVGKGLDVHAEVLCAANRIADLGVVGVLRLELDSDAGEVGHVSSLGQRVTATGERYPAWPGWTLSGDALSSESH